MKKILGILALVAGCCPKEAPKPAAPQTTEAQDTRDPVRDLEAEIDALRRENSRLQTDNEVLEADLARARVRKIIETVPRGEFPIGRVLFAASGEFAWVAHRRGDRLTLGCYATSNNGKNLRMVDAREIAQDLELEQLRPQEPSVAEVRKLLGKK